ncbi:hypothetical protein E9232_003390 [Inquilinus ginsengisoli]|uniref:Uncharacterized protein n=1 Tax=Inquilinus ginsengisoli TaxID=363840 RepID=A0ABU1JS83_9PROT|nr:hypothetical protein [Inquilinus ginsengisoli]
MVLEDVYVGQDVGFGCIHEGGQLGQFGPELAGGTAPLSLAGGGILLANAVAMKAETTRRPLLPACARTFLMTCTRQRC